MANEERTKLKIYIIYIHSFNHNYFTIQNPIQSWLRLDAFWVVKKRKVILLYHLHIFNSTPCYTLQKLTESVMNLANLPQEEKDKINVDLAASGIAYKERFNMPVVASEVERQQPVHLRCVF